MRQETMEAKDLKQDAAHLRLFDLRFFDLLFLLILPPIIKHPSEIVFLELCFALCFIIETGASLVIKSNGLSKIQLLPTI